MGAELDPNGANAPKIGRYQKIKMEFLPDLLDGILHAVWQSSIVVMIIWYEFDTF